MSEDAGTGLPLYGIAADSQAWTDDDYVDSLFAGKRQHKQPVFTKITPQQVEQIEQALQTPTYAGERGSEEYLREVCADRQQCPLCTNYNHYDRYLLQQHINKHPEVKAFLQAQRNAESQYERLQERSKQIRQQLARLRGELAETDRRLEKFDSQEYAQDSKLAQKLARLLWG